MTRKRLLVLSVAAMGAGIAAAAIGCSGSSPISPSNPAPIFDEPFMTAYEGCDGTYVGGGAGGASGCVALRSQAELNTFWTSLWSDPVPQVDFSQVWAIGFYEAYCMGCCGATWKVQSVEETPDCISIEIQHIGCGPECDGDASCACVVLVTVPQADKPICGSPGFPDFTCPSP
jgi:hypothetical protein